MNNILLKQSNSTNVKQLTTFISNINRQHQLYLSSLSIRQRQTSNNHCCLNSTYLTNINNNSSSSNNNNLNYNVKDYSILSKIKNLIVQTDPFDTIRSKFKENETEKANRLYVLIFNNL
ncbi:hypothetical protein PPL_09177 [Heterostelium album PN500]|uniref:Uncharacterized protein n=1 Tax=Heterostelium pallidum (strain ATCC 26659 / Pp 5 / PN500) TaxID=670386 RepID=D3BKU5_HETP5|nr:hypothetical protein PPL_09177 [Heterostelium album PN500]EFA78525.1 hypothetical protein PPL_09177 [Heterostelium album PN500]|eukprot:XP_020430649.1 hypothetical protein PPL_09177 [Heterostelium album PN500]